MSSYADVHRKTKLGEREAALRLKNNRLGMTIFQASWIMAFLALIVVNWQLRYSYAQWPPAGVTPFDATLPSIATLALLLSALLTRCGWQGLRRGDRAQFTRSWRLALLLGLGFVASIVYEFITVSEAALATHYGVTLRLMTGFHLVHALAIMAVLLYVLRQGASGAYSGDPRQSWAAEGAAKLWYFVTVAWILFYVVLYWLR